MPRETKVWWNAQKGTWCTDFGGKRRTLAKGRQNKQAAKDKLKSLLEEQALPARVNGTIDPHLPAYRRPRFGTDIGPYFHTDFDPYFDADFNTHFVPRLGPALPPVCSPTLPQGVPFVSRRSDPNRGPRCRGCSGCLPAARATAGRNAVGNEGPNA